MNNSKGKSVDIIEFKDPCKNNGRYRGNSLEKEAFPSVIKPQVVHKLTPKESRQLYVNYF